MTAAAKQHVRTGPSIMVGRLDGQGGISEEACVDGMMVGMVGGRLYTWRPTRPTTRRCTTTNWVANIRPSTSGLLAISLGSCRLDYRHTTKRR